jgi:hypothetical protein
MVRMGALKLAAACCWIWYAKWWILNPYSLEEKTFRKK